MTIDTPVLQVASECCYKSVHCKGLNYYALVDNRVYKHNIGISIDNG